MKTPPTDLTAVSQRSLRAQKIILKEVSHHLARGRSAERIAIWMNKPMSVINQAIQQL